jgi:hypothetical protein
MVDMFKKQIKVLRTIHFVSEFMIFSPKKKAYSPQTEAYPPQKKARSPQNKVHSPGNATRSRKKEAYPPKNVFRTVEISKKCANGQYFRADKPLSGADTPHFQVNKPNSRSNFSCFGADKPHFLQNESFPGTKISQIEPNMQNNISNIKNFLKEIN